MISIPFFLPLNLKSWPERSIQFAPALKHSMVEEIHGFSVDRHVRISPWWRGCDGALLSGVVTCGGIVVWYSFAQSP